MVALLVLIPVMCTRVCTMKLQDDLVRCREGPRPTCSLHVSMPDTISFYAYLFTVRFSPKSFFRSAEPALQYFRLRIRRPTCSNTAGEESVPVMSVSRGLRCSSLTKSISDRRIVKRTQSVRGLRLSPAAHSLARPPADRLFLNAWRAS
jgi:hypothetical protein